MCVGIPMQVLSVGRGHAQVMGRGEQRTVNTRLVGEPAVGDWLLVFLEDAREALSAARAAEVNATLDLLEAALQGHDVSAGFADAAFELPSALDTETLRGLTQGAVPAADSRLRDPVHH